MPPTNVCVVNAKWGSQSQGREGREGSEVGGGGGRWDCLGDMQPCLEESGGGRMEEVVEIQQQRRLGKLGRNGK